MPAARSIPLSSAANSGCNGVTVMASSQRSGGRTAAPQFGTGYSGTFRQRTQLGPHDRGVHPLGKGALREAAVGAAQHILAADDLGEPNEALRHQLGMLDDVGGVADDAGNELLAGRQLG